MRKRGFIILIILSVLAIIDSAYLAQLHYSGKESFCDKIQGFSCSTVNTGAYSEFPPWTWNFWVDRNLPSIPNAVLGIIGFVIVLALSLYGLAVKDGKKQRKITKFLLIFLIISFIYGMFLVYVQKFIVGTWCLLCLVLDDLIISSLITACMMHKER